MLQVRHLLTVWTPSSPETAIAVHLEVPLCCAHPNPRQP